MASSGGWLLFSFILVILAMSFRTSSSLRCERGLANCVDDELVLSRLLKKRALQHCQRFSCLGRKRETDEKEPQRNPENENQAVDEFIDDILLKRAHIKREKVASSRPPCQRFACNGRKRSPEPPEEELGPVMEMIPKRKSHVACLGLAGCKRTLDEETFSSPKNPENSEIKHQKEEDSKPDCFRFGCKKRELTGEEKTGLPVVPNEKTEVVVPITEDDTQKPRCWRFGCKRSKHLQTLGEKISERFNEKPFELKQYQEKHKKEIH